MHIIEFYIYKIQEQAKLSYADKIQKDAYLRKKRLLEWKRKIMRNFLSNENVLHLDLYGSYMCENTCKNLIQLYTLNFTIYKLQLNLYKNML